MMDLRNAVKQNLAGQNTDGLSSVIEDAISKQEDKTLPGLGVMMEIFWDKSSTEERRVVLERIVSGL